MIRKAAKHILRLSQNNALSLPYEKIVLLIREQYRAFRRAYHKIAQNYKANVLRQICARAFYFRALSETFNNRSKSVRRASPIAILKTQ